MARFSSAVRSEAQSFLRRYVVRNGLSSDLKQSPVEKVAVRHAVLRFNRRETLRAWSQSPTLSPRAQAYVWSLVDY